MKYRTPARSAPPHSAIRRNQAIDRGANEVGLLIVEEKQDVAFVGGKQ